MRPPQPKRNRHCLVPGCGRRIPDCFIVCSLHFDQLTVDLKKECAKAVGTYVGKVKGYLTIRYHLRKNLALYFESLNVLNGTAKRRTA